jgi:hypothetical protein
MSFLAGPPRATTRFRAYFEKTRPCVRGCDESGRALTGGSDEIANLNHEGGHALVAPLRVHLAASNEGCLSLGEEHTLSVAAGHPTAARGREEELPESSQVRADLPSRLEIDDGHMRLARTVGNRRRRGELRLVLRDLLGAAGVEAQDLHPAILPEMR